MNRRTFLQLSATGFASSLLTLPGCQPPRLPTLREVEGPLAVAPDLRRLELLPHRHTLRLQTPGGTRTVGGVGFRPGQLNFPTGIVVLGELAYVVELGNHRIQRFDLEGQSRGIVDGPELNYPGALAALGDGLLVADSRSARLVELSTMGVLRRVLGAGMLSAPAGVATDGERIFVADPGLRQVLELDRAGAVQRAWGDGWILPVAVATDGDHLFVVDASASEVAVFDRAGARLPTLPLTKAARYLSLGSDGVLYAA
jgi:DNA-binding beta-propeller fold protein YncE